MALLNAGTAIIVMTSPSPISTANSVDIIISGQWEAKGQRKKKIYEITDEGRRLLEGALQKQQQMAEVIGSLFREFTRDILETKLPPALSPFDFFPFGKNLEGKSIDEQMRVLKLGRTRMIRTIKLIDKRLERLKELK